MTVDELCEAAMEVISRDIEIRLIHAADACWWPEDECPYWKLHDDFSRLDRSNKP